MKLLHLDVETSSLDSYKGAILEVAAIPSSGEPFHRHLQPHNGAIVEDKALSINGLSREELGNSSRLLPGAAFNEFLDFLGSLVDPFDKSDKLFFCAFNAPFDLRFIEQWFKRNGNRWFGSYFWRPPLCTYALSAFHLGAEWSKLPDHKLATIATRLDVRGPSEGGLHEALFDTWLSKGIYEKIKERHEATQ